MSVSETFSCPLLSPEEAHLIAIPFDDIENETNGIKTTMERYGYCIVLDTVASETVPPSPTDKSPLSSNDIGSNPGSRRAATTLQTLERSIEEDFRELIDDDAARLCGDKKLRAAVQRCVHQGFAGWPSVSLRAIGEMDRLQGKGMPHGRFAWGCRTHSNVRRVYEVLHGTDDLVSSCDNTFLSVGTEEAGENRLWPHVDQNDHDFSVAGHDIYQGLLYCRPSTDPRSSTTVVWPGSHLPEVYDLYMDDAFLRQRGRKRNHFTAVSMLQDPTARRRMMDGFLSNARRVPVPSGALLLWSSRTTHQGWTGGPRLAQPVCWEPRDRRSERAMGRKRALAALGLPSTHSASQGCPHNLVGRGRPGVTVGGREEEGGEYGLPLRAGIRSRALKDGVDVMEVWDSLKGINFECISLKHLDYLESVLKEKFKAVV